MNKKEYRALLDDICTEDCPADHECILKEFLVSSHPSPRLLIQLKCIDRYKKLCENIDCKKMPWSDAMERWVKSGKAKKFAEVYKEDKSYLEIYKQVMDQTPDGQ